jgi:tetratricopeptide (TPR) repeat protein
MAEAGAWDRQARRLVRRLRRPSALEREPAGELLRERLGTRRVADAVSMCVERALADEDPRFAEIVRRCDAKGEPTKSVARDLNVSARQFFRYRAEALQAIACEMRALVEKRPVPPLTAPIPLGGRELAMARVALARSETGDEHLAAAWARRALAVDPSLSAAWSIVALTEISRALASTADGPACYARAHEALRQAEIQGSRSGEVLAARATWLWWALRDARAARELARDALQTEDGAARANSTLGWIAALEGDFDESEARFGDAVALAPETYAYHASLMAAIYLRADYPRAARRCAELLEVAPHCAYTLGYYAESLNALGRSEDCVRVVDEAPREARGFAALSARGVALARLGAADQAAPAVEDGRMPAVARAQLAMALGDVDRTWRLLEDATREPNGMLDLVRFDPVFAPLRDERRLRALVREAARAS